MTTTQTAITAPLAGGASLTAIVYPRLKTAQPVQARRTAQAGVFHVASGDRTDTIVISDDTQQFGEAGRRYGVGSARSSGKVRAARLCRSAWTVTTSVDGRRSGAVAGV